MRLLLAVLCCAAAQFASAVGLNVSPLVLPDRQVGVLVDNDTSHRVSIRKVSIARHLETGAGQTLRMDFPIAPFELSPGGSLVFPLAGLGLDAFVRWLPHEWHDLFTVDDVAELSLRRRGCISCDYQPDVWAWNTVLQFEFGYEASLGGAPTIVIQKAYVHFWKPRRKGGEQVSHGMKK